MIKMIHLKIQSPFVKTLLIFYFDNCLLVYKKNMLIHKIWRLNLVEINDFTITFNHPIKISSLSLMVFLVLWRSNRSPWIPGNYRKSRKKEREGKRNRKRKKQRNNFRRINVLADYWKIGDNCFKFNRKSIYQLTLLD